MKFDVRNFRKEALVLFLISIFIFALTAISLYAQTNTRVMSVIAAEPAGYVGYYDEHYDSSNNGTIKRIASLLEQDTAHLYEKEIYVLDEETGEFISSAGDVPDAVKDQLTSKVNEKLIIIDESSCNVTDFEHYKVLVKAKVPYIADQFYGWLATLAQIMLGVVAFALLALTLVHRFFPEGSKRRLVSMVVLILVVVASFAGNSLYVELETINLAKTTEETAVRLDLEAVCKSPEVMSLTDQSQLLEVGNAIAQASQTVKQVTSSVDLQGKAIDPAAAEEIVGQIQIVSDDAAINNLKLNSKVEALLMLLLGFMLVYEFQKKARLQRMQKERGSHAELTANDYRMRTVLMVNGICMSSFSIVNVLRIRQVVMMHWTDGATFLISSIFTATMLAGVFGSSISSGVLKRCKNVKTYAVVVLGMAMAGGILCGAFSEPVIFIAGLLLFNMARAQISVLSDFYSSLVSDVDRKDNCQVEFSSSDTLGRVVGNIIGGVISVVVSYGFVMLVAAGSLGASVLMCLSFKKRELAVKPDEGSVEKAASSNVLKALFKVDVVVYAVCIVLPASISFTLVQYKLPLDVAALGLSAVFISLAKTVQRVIQVYANQLYHVVSRRLSATAHLVAYVALSGVTVLFYVLSSSLLGMVASVAAMGFVGGAGYYTTTKAFREMDALAGEQESDRMAGLNLARRAGDTVAPTLLSVFGNGAVLPAMIIAAPFVYLARLRLRARARA